jgi:signal transduction histidine kinase
MEKKENEYLLNLSHEFKAPITNLNLLLNTLYDHELSISIKQKRDIIELGLRETRRLRELITQFLHFREDVVISKEEKEKPLFPSFLEKSEVSYELIFFCTNSFTSFSFHSLDNPGRIDIYRKLYLHILINLLENASKFISEVGWATVENDILTTINLSSFTYYRISRSSVTDNGLGFNDQNLLSADSNSLDSSTQGGMEKLGLAIVKRILLLHSSVLTGLSYPYRGSKLFFIMDIVC